MVSFVILSIGLLGADVEGRTNRDLQALVDRAAAQGGGEVLIPAGTYDMEDSLHLRSRVRIRGQSDKTILRKRPSVSSPLSADLGYGHFDVSLAEPEEFRVGMGVHVHDNQSGGFYDTVATITWRDGDRFGIDRMLNHDYGRRAGCVVTSIFPVISGYHLEDATVDNLTIDGNKAANPFLNGCRGGGVFLLQAHRVNLKGLRVKDYNGDGISFQQCRCTVIENCTLEGMAGFGLHPGSGSVGAVLRNNACRNNGSDGIYYCLRVSFSLCENNVLEQNGGFGISIGGRDTDHLIRRNTIRGNAKAGVHFRDGDVAMAGSRNQIEANLLENNCRKEGSAEIDVRGATRDVHLLGNTIRPAGRQGKPAVGLLVGPQADRVVFFGNQVEGADAVAVKTQGPASAVSTQAPAKPLAVGPDNIPSTGAAHLGTAAGGPLRVHPANPRYFTDGSGKAILLVGSHTWGNLQDYTYDKLPSPPAMDFDAYLAFLKEHNHNFFRLWAWESCWNPGARQGTIHYEPMPYERPGPGTALDGKPKFDLGRFNPAYFDRLRARVVAAGKQGIYASVMLLNGFSIEGKGNVGGDPWRGHPLNPANNVQGIDGGGSRAVHTLANPAVTAQQEAYVRKVIDTVNDLDNVLYEITNEDTGSPANTAWQIHIIKSIHRYEAGKARQHPVGMTQQWPGHEADLLGSPAAWISPGSKLFAADGRKVVLNDTDHSYFWTGLKADGVAAQRAWVWENFTRGSQCLFMDPYLDPSHDPGRNNPAGGRPDPYWDPLRQAMGRTRSCAARMDLAAMVPHGDLASTGFCLANPRQEYFVYAPKGGEVTVDLSGADGELTVEWMNPGQGTVILSGTIGGGAKRTLKAPFAGDAVLYLKKK